MFVDPPADCFIVPKYEARPGTVPSLSRSHTTLQLRTTGGGESPEAKPRFRFGQAAPASPDAAALSPQRAKSDAISVASSSLQAFLSPGEAFTSPTRTGTSHAHSAVFSRTVRTFPIVMPTINGGEGPSILPVRALLWISAVAWCCYLIPYACGCGAGRHAGQTRVCIKVFVIANRPHSKSQPGCSNQVAWAACAHARQNGAFTRPRHVDVSHSLAPALTLLV